jgi:hypothetical protein
MRLPQQKKLTFCLSRITAMNFQPVSRTTFVLSPHPSENIHPGLMRCKAEIVGLAKPQFMPGLLPPLILQVRHFTYKLHACRLWSVSTRGCQFAKIFSVVKS